VPGANPDLPAQMMALVGELERRLEAEPEVVAVTFADALPAIHGAHAPWRYTLISGVIPALPLIVIRPFLPESPAWREKKQAGTLRRPSLAAIFQGELRRTTIVTTIMFACSYGAAFGAIQQMPGVVPGLPEVAALARPAQERSCRRCRPSRSSAASPAARCSPCSRSTSSRGASCCASSRCRA
jgi:MFS family permease